MRRNKSALEAGACIKSRAFTITSPQVVKGDVNGDLKVNSTDFSMLRRYLLKIIDNFPTENGKQAADLNGDGRINSSDLTMLKRYLLMEVDL